MKTRIQYPLIVSILIVFLCNGFQYVFSQNIAINSTGSVADTSAMLDVNSANKGVLIPQINLASLTDASTIIAPAHSLLIYNTNASLAEGKGYYYNSGTTVSPVWLKLVQSGKVWKLAGNAGTSPGTDFIGTTDAQGLVIKTNGSSRVNISSAGITSIGDGTNQSKFATDGTMTLEGTATVFKDLNVPVFATSNGGSNPPTVSIVKSNGSGSQGVFTYFFSASTEQELYFTVQLTHDWKEGTAIFPHVHWVTNLSVGATKVRWGLEYTWVNIAGTFSNTNIIYGEDPITPVGTVTAYKHAITEIGAGTGIDATGMTISSYLICRIFRDATSANDTFLSTAGLLGIDFHYEVDALGSSTEYAK